MAFTEDLSVFMDVAEGFALAATLNGSAVEIISDSEGVDVFDGQAVTTMPSCLISAAQAASAAAGQSLVVGATTYTVRAKNAEPPDGALVRLTLTRA